MYLRNFGYYSCHAKQNYGRIVRGMFGESRGDEPNTYVPSNTVSGMTKTRLEYFRAGITLRH